MEPEFPDSHASDLHLSLARHLRDQAAHAALTSFAVLVIVAVLLRDELRWDFLLWWVSAGTLLFVGRVGLLVLDRSSRRPLPVFVHTSVALLASGVWVALLLAWTPGGDLPVLSVLAPLVPAGMTVGALAVYVSHPPSFHAFAQPIYATTLYVAISHHAYEVALPYAVFVLWQTVFLWRFHRMLRHVFELRYEKAALVEDLSRQNRDLAAARDAASAASLAKSEFLARMSHEIRTPMNGVLGMAQLLRRERLDARTESIVDMLYGSGERLMELIDELLDVSRLEAGKLVLESIEFDVREAVEDAVEPYRAKAARKMLSLSVEMAADVPARVHGDRIRIVQIIGHLLDNAVKFTEQGGVSVELAMHEERLAVTIHDTGIGIPTDRHAIVFELFHQLDGADDRRFEGSGLGLAIVQALVTLMQGDVHVDSEPGRGTRITLSLPLAAADSSASTQSIVASATTVQRILVAEDNPVNQLVIESMLEGLDLEVTLVDDGLEAVAAVEHGDFGLVLMDCQMPNLDGFAATRRLRELGFDRPVIAVTANALAGDRERCLDAGMNDYLSKPFEAADLERLLQRWGVAGASEDTERAA